MNDTELCTWCGQPLMRFEWPRHIVLACDNPFCPGGFRERQGIISRNGDELKVRGRDLNCVNGGDTYHLAH